MARMTPAVAAEIFQDIDDVVGMGLPSGDSAVAAGAAYEGADQFNQWLAQWQPGTNSADGDMLPIKALADARSRDVARNDGYVQAGQGIAKDSIVGGMYLANSKPEHKHLRLDEKWAEEFQEEVETKFTLAAESPNCWLDAQRTKTFTGMMRLATGIYSSTGEVLASAEWLRDKPRPFKTAIQFIDLDRLTTPYDRGDQIIRGGVRLNSMGAPQGYYIRNAHPTDFDRLMTGGDAFDWKYVPARKSWGRMQMIHLKEENRAAQTRAVADIVAGLKSIKITQKFRDLTLQQAVLQAMYAVNIESDLPPEAAFATLGQTTGPGAAVAKYGAEYLAAVQKFIGKKGITIDNVKIPHFFPGTRLNVRNAGAPGGPGQDFEKSLLRHIAAVLGVSYEELSKDYSKTNYSSARAALSQTWKFMQSRKKLFADRLATIIYTLWFEEQMNAGEIEAMKYSKCPNYYDGLNSEAYCAVEWIGAARGQIDELKETQAAVLRIKFGLSTHEDELAKLGKDWRKVYAQLERETAERKRRGIILLEDNSVNAASGSPREQDEKSTEGETANAEAA